MTDYGKQLQATETMIPGLVVFDLPVHGDARGWFKENWQREKMTALGLSDFGPVQNNISFNDAVGTTRGIHAEPWDKWVSVATGRIFGAWVDLREGPSFGAVYTTELDPSKATDSGPAGNGVGVGDSVISGFRSKISKTRSKLTSALITSTRADASPVSGAYSRVISSASATTAPGSRVPRNA